MGRPTKYDPTYCDMVVESSKRGFSLAGFAGSIGVSRATINVWMAAHPDFLEAVSRAKAAAAYCWESRANRVAEVGGGPGTAQVLLFALRNVAPEDWSADRRAKIALPVINSAKSAAEAIAKAVEAFALGQIDAPHAETVVSIARTYLGAAVIVDLEAEVAALKQGDSK